MMEFPGVPQELLDVSPYPRFLASDELDEWARETFVAEGAELANPDHAHLNSARIGWLWSSEAPSSRGRTVLGSAEIPQPRGPAFKKAREEFFLRQLLGALPDFIVTLSAPAVDRMVPAQICALVEHELYHCAQMVDRWGAPKFTQEGRPRWTIRGHDVEEFVGVVRRYGASAAGTATEALVEAAGKKPEVSVSEAIGVCGTCLRVAA